jgi:hypothetical protein
VNITRRLTCRVSRCASVTFGAEAVRDGEGEAEQAGREDPAGRRRGARFPAGLLGRERRAAGEGPPVLPLHATGGPIARMLFSCPPVRSPSAVIASSPSLPATWPPGVPYKVVVPLERIERVKPSENAEKPEQKHIRWSPRRRIRVLVHGVRELTEMLHVGFSIKTSNQ